MFQFRNVCAIGFEKARRKLHTSTFLQKAVLIDGNKVANEIHNDLRITVDALVNAGLKRPKLVAILVGDDPASKTYVGRKMKAAKSIGIDSSTINLSDKVTQSELIKEIQILNEDPSVDGVLVQLPVPKGINEREICQAIYSKKDVDGFHLDNLGNLTLDSRGIIPATALAVRELIVRTKIQTFGKNAVVVGRSKHVGLPIAILLHADGKGETGALDMTTTICHRNTPHTQLTAFTKLADLVVVAAGVPGLITKDMIKPGACVIDVGINRVKDHNGKYKLVGDVDFEGVKEVAGYITPVPGGVGPMTVAMLMKNTIAVAIDNLDKEAKNLSIYESLKAKISG